ncbi:ankyrin [Penicillium concentricum]|uniref:Ankyrin n=1 Tax=Penicillium concentricum TaxID=293559 RepID=A0A9W9RCX0_9EURO|nr:ankyrin [Penicillium concentricum]KAJ5356584.1 ankyrin [Penicillium concentricum]
MKGLDSEITSVVELLITKCDVNLKGFNGLTPLHFAAISGHRTLVEFLEGADVKAKNDNIGWTSLHCAAGSGDLELVRLLIRRGAAVDVADNQVGWTPLHIGAMSGHKDIVDVLLNGYNEPTEDNYGWTPRQFAELNGHAEVVELLDVKDSKGTDTVSANEDLMPLDVGERERRSLLRGDPSIGRGQIGIYGQIHPTSLHCKAINDGRGIVEILSDTRRDFYFTDEDKNGILQQFSNEKEDGADKHAKSLVGETPLHLAVKCGHKTLARLLLQKRAATEAKDENGMIPLHWAGATGDDAVAQLLLLKDADKVALDRNGMTPLH